MKLDTKNLPRETIIQVILAYPNAKKIDKGYEIPKVGKHSGRTHILFATEGLEIHRDRNKHGKHYTYKGQSKSIQDFVNYFREAMESLT